MKKFNIILIVCLALISISSACSKDEDSPYTREEIIGKWNQKSYWETDKSGNGKWVDYPDIKLYYYQFNTNGTFFTYQVHDERDSSWELKGNKIYCRSESPYSDKIEDFFFEIISLDNNELIVNYKINNGNMNKGKFLKEIE